MEMKDSLEYTDRVIVCLVPKLLSVTTTWLLADIFYVWKIGRTLEYIVGHGGGIGAHCYAKDVDTGEMYNLTDYDSW